MMTLDCHIDTPWQFTKQGWKKPRGSTFTFDLRQRQASAVDFPRMKEGGLDAAVFALYISDTMQDDLGSYDAWEAILAQISWLHLQPGCSLVADRAAAEVAARNGDVPIFLGLEGGRLIGDTLSKLAVLALCGVRYLTVTHNRNTAWADSATDAPHNGCITAFGKQVVTEAERLGIIMDVSHGSDETALSIINMSTKPVIASHSGCRALVDHPRNLSDVLIQAIAQTGGVIHIPFARRFIGPSALGVIDHIHYVAQLVGVEHVGIGSDLDGAAMADGLEDVSCWSRIRDGLSDAGYGEDSIDLITGGNTLRVLAK